MRAGLRQRVLDVAGFVEAAVLVAKRPQRAAGTRLRTQAGRRTQDGCGVEPARQVHAHRHIAAHVHAHGVFEQVGKGRGGVGARQLWGRLDIPVRPLAISATERQLERMPGRDLIDAFVERLFGLVEPAFVQEPCRRAQVQRVAIQAAGANRLDLGRKDEEPVIAPPVQGLDSEPVASAEKDTPLTVEDQKRPHAVQAGHAVDAPLPVRGQQHFRVAARSEAMAQRTQLLAQLDEVEDLAVEDDGAAAVLGVHRLVTKWRQVQDRQPAKAKRDGAGDRTPGVVRATMDDALQHAVQGIAGRRTAAQADDRSESAHG